LITSFSVTSKEYHKPKERIADHLYMSSLSSSCSLPPSTSSSSSSSSSPDFELLTDLEVYNFIKQQQEDSVKSTKTKQPENLVWMQQSIMSYFADSKIKSMNNEKITSFIHALKEVDKSTLGLELSKRELLHLVNHVPTTGIALGVCMDSQRVEDSDTGDALTQEQEDIILELVKEHLL
jgi:hypothetical protein